MDNLGILKVFKPFGFLAVSLFFFYSGYGVMIKHINNRYYLCDFLKRRLTSVYVLYFFIMCLWFLINICFKNYKTEFNTFRLFILNVFLIKMSLPFAWYVQVIIVWYIIFYLVMKNNKCHWYGIRLLLIFNIVWYFTGMLLRLDSFYYNNTFCLILGVLIAFYENKKTQNIEKKFF